MTCIVGTREGLWADRKITADSGQACDPIRKLAKGRGYIAGFAGEYESILAALAAVEQGMAAEDVAKQHRKVEGLVLRAGRLYWLDSGRMWPKRNVYAIGSGYAEAMSFLAGRGRHRPVDIRAAHRHVARVRDDCGRGVTHLRPV